MKKNEKILIICIVITLVISLVGCNDAVSELHFNGKLQEIVLPADTHIISDLEVDGDGNLFIATMKHDTGTSGSIANIWRLEENKEWYMVFEKKILPDESKDSEALISLIDDKAIICDYNCDPKDPFSGTYDLYRVDDISNNNITKVFAGVDHYSLSQFCGMKVNGVYSVDSVTGSLVKLDFVNSRMDEIKEPTDVVQLQSSKNLGYIIYRQKYEITEEEKAELDPMSDDPSKYARGIIYNLDNGTIKESSLFDQVAIRFFEKWNKGGLNTYNSVPLCYPCIDSKEEAYYLAHNDGLYRIDENGETLIYYDNSWDREGVQLNKMVVTSSGDIYLCVYFDDFSNVKIFKIYQ